MKKITIIFICLICTCNIFAQNSALSEFDLNFKLDSILAESDLLYKYEKSAWLSTDYAVGNPFIREKMGRQHFTYEYSDGIKTIILNSEHDKVVAEYHFKNNFDALDSYSVIERNLTELESKLISTRNNILNKIISERKYDIFSPIPRGFALNFVLIPFGEKYKFYILTGTTLNKIIPFGNDFLFITDQDGNVESWQKFHSRFLAMQTEIDGEKVLNSIHSHLETTPFITATEIATFKLYAPLYDIPSFSILSTAL